MDATETSNVAASAAARALVARRWGASKPSRLARELVERAGELPDEDRKRVLDALLETRGGSAA
jgi:hypothetical protein